MMKIVRTSPDNTDPLSVFESRFNLPRRPSEEMPELPMHLDSLDSPELMDLYRDFMAWMSYAHAELVKAEIAEDKEAHRCRITEATCLIGQWSTDSKGDRVTLAKARRDVDPEVVAQQEAYNNSRAYRKLVQTMYESCERGAQLLSRELSRRIGTHSKEARLSKYTP